MGDPRPYINWVHIEDMARMLAMALKNEKMRGAYNAVAPNPVTNRDFARAIARTLGRPALLRFPAPVLEIILGEAGRYASGGPRVRGEKIQASGYRCFFSDLDRALGNLLA
jgi:NAD dependent epimerase/dehydratase family enzyme